MTTEPIELIVLDIDGVISDGEAQPLDLGLMAELAAMNQTARREPWRPAVTLCTGRPAAYLEVFLQAIDGHHPGIFENGAGMYHPSTYRFIPHPELEAHLDRFERIKPRLRETLVATGFAYFQPGKEYSLTLFASDPGNTRLLQDRALDALGELAEKVDLVYSSSCLNVLPRGVDKGKGLAFLAQTLEIGEDRMLGVGDSDVDLPFLARVGTSAAPSNANAEVRQLVDYVASLPTAAGVRDILTHFGLRE